MTAKIAALSDAIKGNNMNEPKEQEAPVDLDDIKPTMTAEQRERARKEILKALKEFGR